MATIDQSAAVESPNRRNWQNVLAFVILSGAYLFSAAWVAVLTVTSTTDEMAGKTVITIAHSIADRSVQKAFDKAAADYQELHPNTRVKIQAIPQRAYQQWVTTQCVGGTAPDLINAQATAGLWSPLAAQYFMPLSAFVNRPNPYNRRTDLDGVRWRDTYIDNMRGGYWMHLTEFFSIPITSETSRMFYNKDIYKAATGTDEPPADLNAWFNACEKIREYAIANDRADTLFAIAGSGVGTNNFTRAIFDRYYKALCNGLSDPYDSCYWNAPRVEQTLYALYTDSWTFDIEPVRASCEIVKRVADYCQPGFISNDESQARFLFLQERAATIMGSVRDAAVYFNSADFNVGVFDFPIPSWDDPRYGQYKPRLPSEATFGSLHFALNRRSANPDAALDFMMFLTSQGYNSTFNNEVGWFPAILGASPRDELRPFEPRMLGVSGGRIMPMYAAGDMKGIDLWFDQQFPRFLAGQVPLDRFLANLENVWRTKGPGDFERRDRTLGSLHIQTEANVSDAKVQFLFESGGELQAGTLIGERTGYQLALEMQDLLNFGITSRAYCWHHLQQGNYEYP